MHTLFPFLFLQCAGKCFGNRPTYAIIIIIKENASKCKGFLQKKEKSFFRVCARLYSFGKPYLKKEKKKGKVIEKVN